MYKTKMLGCAFIILLLSACASSRSNIETISRFQSGSLFSEKTDTASYHSAQKAESSQQTASSEILNSSHTEAKSDTENIVECIEEYIDTVGNIHRVTNRTINRTVEYNKIALRDKFVSLRDSQSTSSYIASDSARASNSKIERIDVARADSTSTHKERNAKSIVSILSQFTSAAFVIILSIILLLAGFSIVKYNKYGK